MAGWELEARACGPQTGAPCLAPRPGEAGRGWHSPLGGLADTAAAGRARLSCTKLLFSEAPSSPGPEPVGGRGTVGMCRVRKGVWEGISARCQILTALTAGLHCRLLQEASLDPWQSVPLPPLDCGSGGPSQAPASELPS